MSQYQRVEETLRATLRPLALHQIHEAIRTRYGVLDSEAAISARIREIRHALEVSGEGTVATEPVEGKAYLRYRIHVTAQSIQQSDLFAG